MLFSSSLLPMLNYIYDDDDHHHSPVAVPTEDIPNWCNAAILLCENVMRLLVLSRSMGLTQFFSFLFFCIKEMSI